MKIIQLVAVLGFIALGLAACEKEKAPTSAPSAGSAASASAAIDPGAPDTEETRRAAVQVYLKIVPVSDLLDDISTKMAAQMQPTQAQMFKTLMKESFDVKALEEAMQNSMVKRFTLAEIQALSNFYSTAAGKSVMRKMGDYMSDVMPTIQQQIGIASMKAQAAK